MLKEAIACKVLQPHWMQGRARCFCSSLVLYPSQTANQGPSNRADDGDRLTFRNLQLKENNFMIDVQP